MRGRHRVRILAFVRGEKNARAWLGERWSRWYLAFEEYDGSWRRVSAVDRGPARLIVAAARRRRGYGQLLIAQHLARTELSDSSQSCSSVKTKDQRNGRDSLSYIDEVLGPLLLLPLVPLQHAAEPRTHSPDLVMDRDPAPAGTATPGVITCWDEQRPRGIGVSISSSKRPSSTRHITTRSQMYRINIVTRRLCSWLYVAQFQPAALLFLLSVLRSQQYLLLDRML